jgi:hypothetical protein
MKVDIDYWYIDRYMMDGWTDRQINSHMRRQLGWKWGKRLETIKTE